MPSTTEFTKRNLTKKVLFIVADGIPADVLENLPVINMRRIQNMGAYTRAFVGGIKGTYSQTATISSPGYMSLLTGTWGNKHNVYDNYVRKPNYNYKNIFRLVKEQDPRRTIAIFSTWTTNRIRLIGEGLQEAGNITFDYKFDGYELDRISYPHDRRSGYIRNIDERVTHEAAQCIRTDAPDLSWVYLQYTDDVGHYFGDSDPFNQSILLLDERIGQIWDAIHHRISYYQEDWLLIITTDHGRDAKQGKHHAGQSSRERTTWIVTNSRETNSYFQDSQPAIVDVLPTILRFFNLTISIDDERELDGIPFIGRVSFMNPNVTLQNNSLAISWTVLEATGYVKLWLSTTNQFKKGRTDNYTLVATVPIDQAGAIIDVSKNPSQFYKVVLEGPYNTINQWIYRPQLKPIKSRIVR